MRSDFSERSPLVQTTNTPSFHILFPQHQHPILPSSNMSETLFTPSTLLKCATMTTLGLSAFASISELNRQKYSAITLAVAAGTYLNGGLGVVEMPLTFLVAACAAKGLEGASSIGKGKPRVRGERVGQDRQGYRYIATGWALHTILDVVHHNTDLPMVSWLPTSSAECAVTDVCLAVWMLTGAKGWR